ncbi:MULTISPECIES: bifunctional UDP-N-acetylglucosamine diphosphorylase/glucosamine-1-phosphate N-acetyltransferase GlmU [unclassified Arthrobacter]|uniref:bifunctional UDP-N-acetylglucosamine diphosphorylase/glucosamine-1-phosphate N-acetyltransferase GlmU n=2 Tax=Arthrobacter TaxID=1663 RepID=UPI001D15AACA|nr:bifunctional UDP-N-acetylglucosamine diphosphorylase/glucosamine-1-phosphate N-acetyltransferase GlmU [Arthrobacter sp. zg-Y1110]MCC3292024.1 bifunctional UDP-N-acetylglucosamine diphosphorylase/glucosamine-1-phosphate N-acetyltransferase GlmU [Arthrobacter sp. zg-Y1110]MCC3302918.1 bifunctional UDP-N-acetylglucosamine diphosphorylase/glucosamine-1-phosphate N-acetyltransferase GlmU [Arthrobacter sp. zg-Y895]
MTTNDVRTNEASAGALSAVIVLAAGAGTRMKSRTPKILHPVGGISMLGHALAAASELHPRFLAVVVRHERDLVAGHAAEQAPGAVIVDQDEVPGTGRAVQVALSALDAVARLEGTVVVTYGDTPLLEAQTLRNLVAVHETDGNAVTVLTARLADPTGYGRVLRAADGTVTGIVEHKDATDEQRAVNEINSGIYAFDAAVLRSALESVTTSNSQGEMYLTDVLGIARAAGGRISAVVTDDTWQVEGANDRVQLAALNAEHNRRNLDRWMRAGVTVVDPATTWIDSTVTLAEDVTVLPGTQLHGSTSVARDAVVGPDTTLTNVSVGEGASVVRTHGSDAVLGAGTSVGPFAYLRPGTVLGAKGKIGTFVETKNADIGAGSKVPHLSYVGDATIGEQSNIGAASVFVNYDGVNKHHTTIGSHVRMGSDNMYVAPVTVGDGAYSGAGTVIRKDVPAGALAINVAPQRNLDGWVLDKRPGTAAAAAAAASTTNTSSSETDSPTRESDH